MDKYLMTEVAYKRGYEQGKKDAVKHGRWIDNKHAGRFDFRRNCSICQNGSDLATDFCPNCGARMDGADHE